MQTEIRAISTLLKKACIFSQMLSKVGVFSTHVTEHSEAYYCY